MPLGASIPQDQLRDALLARMLVVAEALGVLVPAEATAAEALDVVARAVRASDDVGQAWLLHVGITGSFPHVAELALLRRKLALSTDATVMLSVLEATIDRQSRTHSGLRTIEIATGETLVDVDFCARYEHNTGIQRVVRHTVPHWQDDETRPHRLVAWVQDSTGYRELRPRERDRVLHWEDRHFERDGDRVFTDRDLDTAHVIVPWNSTLILAEVPAFHLCDPLACIAESTNNRVALIGYDAIPLISASSQPNLESERFAHYLTVVKHADVIAGISGSAADEFQGFVDALPSQGLIGPRVVSVSLATEVSDAAKAGVAAGPAHPAEKLILCVGSHEPRKNQDAVLYAAEVLFREGHDFRMVFIGGGSRLATLHFDKRVKSLRRKGMKVESHRGVADRDLWGFFARARFTVFVSLHEGFGLPVAESLALGTPVLTSDFGSLDEVASAGGCLQVDPRDDAQIIAGMKELLLDDATLDRLHDEIAGQTQKSWRTYADELWTSVSDTVSAVDA
jgi:glycosyltransferase involved in cell wall biosynthesis